MTTIRTARLTLRPYRPEQTDLLGRLIRDPRVFFWASGPVTDADVAAVMARSIALRPRGMGWFAAFRHADGEFVGDAVLQPLAETSEIEIGYHLRPEFWGKGYATEASRALLEHGFCSLGLDRIVAVALPEDEASLRVSQRLRCHMSRTCYTLVSAIGISP